MEKFGFVGLPNAGKSSLYNALTGGSALAAPYAFATTDPNVGVAKVPDQRLNLLTAMSKSKSSVPASVQFTDIGGLVEGASKGEGLGNQFLANIREVDAIVYVLRAFEDEDVPGTSDPLEQLRVLEIELTLADLGMPHNKIICLFGFFSSLFNLAWLRFVWGLVWFELRLFFVQSLFATFDNSITHFILVWL